MINIYVVLLGALPTDREAALVQTSLVDMLCSVSHNLEQKLVPDSLYSLFKKITELKRD